MKILHLILTGGYSEDWSYQDSVLVREHAKKNEVYVITTQYERIKDNMVKNTNTNYKNKYGVIVYRIPHKYDFLPEKIKKTLRIYKGLSELLETIKPDIVFSHNLQYFGTSSITSFMKKNPNVRLYVDNHADFSNINNQWISVNILHKILWRHSARKLVPYTNIFWGVLPARVDFLKDIYGVPIEKIKYLPLGAEDKKAEKASDFLNKKKIRDKFGIKQNDFLIITGGKIDRFKTQILNLMEAIRQMNKDNIKLLVFGSILEDMQKKFFSFVDDSHIFYAGWINTYETYCYIAASDLAVYPGRHSVLWEQTAGQGIPMICKFWTGTTHVDLGGNVKFLYHDTSEEIVKVLTEITERPEEYYKMKSVASEKGRQYFSYKRIACESIEILDEVIKSK